MADRNANIVISLRNTADPEVRRLAASFGVLIQQTKTAGATQEQAERQALAHAQALARLAVASGQAAQGERILTAALTQVDRESQAATRAETQLVNVQQQVARGSQQGASLADQFGDSLKSSLLGVIGPAALATAAIGAVKGAADLTVAGESANKTTQAFNQLAVQAGTTGNAILGALRKASGGEISDLNLELAANKANLLGVAASAGQLSQLMEIARDRAQKLGATTTQAFDDLVTGLGRGSPKILDNLGIIVKESEVNEAYAKSIGKTAAALTEAEKKQALINAVLAQGEAGLNAGGAAAEKQANAYARLGTAIENTKNKLGSFLATQTQGTAGSTADLLSGVTGAAVGDLDSAGFEKAAAGAQNLVRAMSGLPPVNAQAQATQEAWASSLGRWLGLAQQATPGLSALTSGINAHALAAIQAAKGVQQDTNALGDELKKKIDSQIVTAQLALQQQQLAADSLLAAQGLLGAGDQALLLAQKYGIAADQAQFLINQQQKIANAQALLDQRQGERGGAPDPFKALVDARNAEKQKFIIGAVAGATQAATQAAAEQKRVADSQTALDLARAKTSTQRIAILQRELAQTTDVADRNRILAQIEGERNSGAKAHTSELGKQLSLNESIRDSIEAQRKAALDAQEAAIRDRQDRRKEEQEARQAQRILSSGRASPEFKAAAADALALIAVHQQQRQLDLANKLATAGGAIVNGRVLQSVPGGGGVVGAPIGPAPRVGAGAAPTGSVPLQTALSGATVNVFIGGERLDDRVDKRIEIVLRGGHAQSLSGGGGIAP